MVRLESNLMKKKLIALLIALGSILGFTSFVAMPSANAVNTYYHGHNWCMYKGIWYAGYGIPFQNTPVTDWYVHVDYSWSEEVFQGKHDYEYYSHRNIYTSGFCG